MQNINPYNQQEFQDWFTKTDTFQKLKNKYQVVTFEKFIELRQPPITPRQRLSINWPSTVSAVPWYYLKYLDCSVQMVDLGCGFNFFKPYFANLIGIGAEDNPDDFYGDIHDYVDDDFYKGHKNYFQSVFCINALHFNPLEELRNICEKFSSMIKPGGQGFLALNLARMVEKTNTMHNVRGEELTNWVHNQFDNFPCNILVLDIDLSVYDAWMDGNVRVVFSK